MIEAYLRVFFKFEQNNCARLLLMAEFTYNNTKNANTGYIAFELNCGYDSRVSYEENLDSCSKSRIAKKLSSELQELITIYQQNFHHTQKLQKRVHNKGVKPQNYAPGDKVWLSSKQLKTKQNCKLKAKFLGPFQVLYPVGK